MENLFRQALIDWLSSSSGLSRLNAIEEESPLSVSPPWLGIAASASIDWSTKDRSGREIRVALELTSRGDTPSGDADMVEVIEQRILTMPANQTGFELVSAQFLRARAERRSNNLRSILIEYRFRILANLTE